MGLPSRITTPVKDRLDRTAWVLSRLRANARYIKQSPVSPGLNLKQLAFLALDCDEALFGGAAGGGKSSSLLMAALMFVDIPGYDALILRRTFQDLNQPGAIMDRAKEWLAGTDARWQSQHKRFVFPSGARLQFGYLKNAGSHLQYQGAEFQSIFFDELTQFEGFQYRYLFSRLRRLKGVDIPLRMRAASNPGGPGHDWVKRRFIDRRRPDRCFIPARFVENPYLDQAEYLKTLAKLDPVTRAQLEKGDWYVSKAGLIYPEFDDCRVEPAEVPWDRLRGCEEWFGGIDWGWNNPFAAVHAVRDDDDVLWVTWCRYKRFMTVAQHAAKLPRDDQEGKQTLWFADPSRPENIRELVHADFACRPAMNRRPEGIDIVKERIATGRLKVVSTLSPLFTEAGMYRDSNDSSQADDVDDEDGEDTPGLVRYRGVVDADSDSYDVVAPTASEEPQDENDHGLDALRYLCAGVEQVCGTGWADRLTEKSYRKPDDERDQEGSFGADGWLGDDGEDDYTRDPRSGRKANPGPSRPKGDAAPGVAEEQRRKWRSIYNEQMWGNG